MNTKELTNQTNMSLTLFGRWRSRQQLKAHIERQVISLLDPGILADQPLCLPGQIFRSHLKRSLQVLENQTGHELRLKPKSKKEEAAASRLTAMRLMKYSPARRSSVARNTFFFFECHLIFLSETHRYMIRLCGADLQLFQLLIIQQRLNECFSS